MEKKHIVSFMHGGLGAKAYRCMATFYLIVYSESKNYGSVLPSCVIRMGKPMAHSAPGSTRIVCFI